MLNDHSHGVTSKRKGLNKSKTKRKRFFKQILARSVEANESADSDDESEEFSLRRDEYISSIRTRFPPRLSDLSSSEDEEVERLIDEHKKENATFFEHTQIGNSRFLLPLSVLSLSSLKSYFNSSFFDSHFSDREKKDLLSLLPGKTTETKNEALRFIFDENQTDTLFPKPLDRIFTNLKNGLYSPQVHTNLERLHTLEYDLYMTTLCEYHEEMLTTLITSHYLPKFLTLASAALPDHSYPLLTEEDTEVDTDEELKGMKKRKRDYTFTELSPNYELSMNETTEEMLPPYFFFAFLKNIFIASNMVVAEDVLLNKLKPIGKHNTEIHTSLVGKHFTEIPSTLTMKLITDIPSNLSVNLFLSLALKFLSSPPHCLHSHQANTELPNSQFASNPETPFPPFVKLIDPNTRMWQWIEKNSLNLTNSSAKDDMLTFCEQLFWFALTREQFADQSKSELVYNSQRQQKCVLTIQRTRTEEVLRYRSQETERYKIPEMPFEYIFNGSRAIVAPLKKGVVLRSGNPSNRPREHTLLRSDRPAHVNLLPLVRDAAARLPGGIGTRPDVVLLLRDSQYIVDNNENEPKWSAIVSSALDRLHSEKDPCVRFDPELKMWIYLHRHRTLQDFETAMMPPLKSAKVLRMETVSNEMI